MACNAAAVLSNIRCVCNLLLVQWLIFFRFWVGLGLGGVPVSFTLYMEFMPTKGRGVWLIWLEAFWTLGSCLEAGLAWLVLDSLGWRWLIGLSSIPLGKHCHQLFARLHDLHSP